MKKQRIFTMMLPIIAIVLELLPYGAVLNFGRQAEDGTIGYFRETYSYFDLMPYGYGNFGPFLTAILTCVLLLILVIFCINMKESLLKAARVLTGVVVFTSIMPLFLGVQYYSVVGAAVTIVFAIEFICLLSKAR